MATGANIAGCEQRGITFYSPVPLRDPATNPALRDDPHASGGPSRLGALADACTQRLAEKLVGNSTRRPYLRRSARLLLVPAGTALALHEHDQRSAAAVAGVCDVATNADAKSCSACGVVRAMRHGQVQVAGNQPRTVRRAPGTARAAHGATGIANEVRAATPRGRTPLCDHQTPVRAASIPAARIESRRGRVALGRSRVQLAPHARSAEMPRRSESLTIVFSPSPNPFNLTVPRSPAPGAQAAGGGLGESRSRPAASGLNQQSVALRVSVGHRQNVPFFSASSILSRNTAKLSSETRVNTPHFSHSPRASANPAILPLTRLPRYL